jgi:DNA-binding transcriptional MerR regulator
VSESLRIGEFSRRVGVSAELLRAWERRYGLLRPVRSAGGFRLYTVEDAERVARMRQGIGRGLSAAQAAEAAIGPGAPSEGFAEGAAARLLEAIDSYDEARVQAVLDEALEALGLEAMIGGVIMPTLAEVGQGWQSDALAISREHFASNLIRARLLSLSRLWGRGTGPLALLACPEGERHDISLIAFGLVMRSRGWRIVFLGAETPLRTIERALAATQPDVTVLASFDPSVLESQVAGLRRLARRGRLLLGGPGATEPLCARLRVQRVDGDLVAAASALAGATIA